MVTVSNNVVILARTRMNNGHICVGGYDRDNHRYVRLLTGNAENQNEDAPYQVGQIYSVSYTNRPALVPPHCEDVCVCASNFIRPLEYFEFNQFLTSISIRNIHIRDLFNGLLHWENGAGFLLRNEMVPNCSVVVVALNHDLFLYQDSRFRFLENGNVFTVKYVGVDNRVPRKINAGRFLRFSLARWWDRDGGYPVERAYLQLSAIY